jgi:hypothetical protein
LGGKAEEFVRGSWDVKSERAEDDTPNVLLSRSQILELLRSLEEQGITYEPEG